MSRKQIGIIIAAGLVFALIFGVRQSVALFIGPINSATGLGIASISLAFDCAQLMWGITQPIAGAVADKYGTGRVMPHMSCAQANARLIEAMPRPVTELI